MQKQIDCTLLNVLAHKKRPGGQVGREVGQGPQGDLNFPDSSYQRSVPEAEAETEKEELWKDG